jgi:hypothetical protein
MRLGRAPWPKRTPAASGRNTDAAGSRREGGSRGGTAGAHVETRGSYGRPRKEGVMQQ